MSIFDTLPRDCWVNIDAGQLKSNLRQLIRAVDKPVLAVVKANAYGHGYIHAAKAFWRAERFISASPIWPRGWFCSRRGSKRRF